jgi:ketosteroid isomerase-like protein
MVRVTRRSRKRWAVLTLAVSTLFGGCPQPHPAAPAAAPVAAQSDLTQALAAAANSGDAAKLTDLYENDAVLMPASGEILRGRDDIAAYWKRFVTLGRRKLNMIVASSSASGAQGYAGGTFDLELQHDGAAATHDNGQFVTVTRLGGDGRWRVVYAIFNSLPAAAN